MDGKVCKGKGKIKGNTELEKKKKSEVIPPRVEEPKLVPTAEAKGFPNPAPTGAWVPMARRESIFFTLIWFVYGKLLSSSILISLFISFTITRYVFYDLQYHIFTISP